MPVTVNDKGWEKLKKRLAQTRPKVKVGIFGEAAAARANDAPGATVGQIANAHEHGLGVPQRSWCAGTIDTNLPAIMAGLRKGAAAVLDPKAPEGLEMKLLAQTGQHVAGLMRQRISSGISPALSPRYLTRKLKKYPGATTPLIASGQMWGAIGSVVLVSERAMKAFQATQRRAARTALSARRKQNRVARRRKRVDRALSKAGKSVRRQARAGSRIANRLARSTRRTSRSILRQARRTAKRTVKRTRKLFR